MDDMNQKYRLKNDKRKLPRIYKVFSNNAMLRTSSSVLKEKWEECVIYYATDSMEVYVRRKRDFHDKFSTMTEW